MQPDLEKQMLALRADIEKMKRNPSLETHSHTGFDMDKVLFSNLSGKNRALLPYTHRHHCRHCRKLHSILHRTCAVLRLLVQGSTSNRRNRRWRSYTPTRKTQQHRGIGRWRQCSRNRTFTQISNRYSANRDAHHDKCESNPCHWRSVGHERRGHTYRSGKCYGIIRINVYLNHMRNALGQFIKGHTVNVGRPSGTRVWLAHISIQKQSTMCLFIN